MRSILVLFLLICCQVSSGQFVVQGTVQDEAGKPLINARVEINSKAQYYFSNKDGIFYYDSSRPIKNISVSHLGYKTVQEQFEALESEDTLTVSFILMPIEKTLDTVNINAISSTEVYTERNYTVMDFMLLPNTILVLVKGQKNYYLKEFSRLNELIQEQEIDFKPTKIVSDCFGQVHLQNDAHSYLLNRNSFQLSSAQTLSNYNRFNAPCMADFDSTLFISKHLDNNQSVIYAVRNKATRKNTLLHTITDEESAYIAALYKQRKEISKGMKIISDMYPSYGDVQNPGQLNSEVVLDYIEAADYYDHIASSPIYHPLFKINDSVYVFDHLENRCSVYDEMGRPFRSFPISHHLSDNWEKRIIINQDKSCVYALMQSTHYFLSEINLENGQIKATYKLDFNCALSPKFEIREHFIYYIYKENKGNGFKDLYRQRLKSI